MPPKRVNKYCKVCFEKTGKKYFGEKQGSRVECPNCGREMPVSGNKPSGGPFSSMDPVRFRTDRSRTGTRENLDNWKAPAPIRRSGRRTPRQSVGKFPRKPEHDVFHNKEYYQVIIYDLPFKDLKDVSCEVISDTLVVESLIEGFEFLQKFSLPENILISSLNVTLKNGILEIRFKKRKRASKSK